MLLRQRRVVADMYAAARSSVSKNMHTILVLSSWASRLFVAKSENESVLQRIADGDPAALSECISRYGGLIWSLSQRLTDARFDAENATLDIFLQIWRRAAEFDPVEGSEIVFVAMIARRTLIDRRRGLKSKSSIGSPADGNGC